MTRQLQKTLALMACAMSLLTGCGPSQPFYFFDDGDMSHYRGVATQIEYADVDPERLVEVEQSLAPYTLRNMNPKEIWDLSLEDAIKYALLNSRVLRTLGGQVQTAPQTLTRTPDAVVSVYDPAIVESNPRIGVEGALAAFDAQLKGSLVWQHNDRPINVGGFGTLVFAPFFEQDYGQEQLEIRKTTATGGTYYLRNNTTYDNNNNPTRLFPSDWNTNIEAEFTHPLLQGAGVQFNRIAGPQAQSGFVGFSTNGVVLARINQDVALSDFEINVRNMVGDVETAYWELYFTYRNLDALLAGRDSALQTWRKVYALYIVGAQGGEAEKEAQAREQYFLFRAQVENALSTLYAVENRLRYIVGLAPTDGRLIRPSDEPTTARLNLEWHEVHQEALARSQELRRQRWKIKQREMELIAARNFLLPRLDLNARYRWLGWGNYLLNSQRVEDNPINNAFQSLTSGQYAEWQTGLQLNMPIGFRREMANVRNAQLSLARERSLIQDQELEIVHLISDALRDVDRFYGVTQSNFNRAVAAVRNVEAVRAAYDTGTVTLDLLLDAQRRRADAEVSYYRSLVDYNLSIRNVHLRKGSLLEYNGVSLAEGPWPGKAYYDARKRARERDAGWFLNYAFTQPRTISRGHYQQFVHGEGVEVQPNTIQVPTEEVPTPQPVPAPSASQPNGNGGGGMPPGTSGEQFDFGSRQPATTPSRFATPQAAATPPASGRPTGSRVPAPSPGLPRRQQAMNETASRNTADRVANVAPGWARP